VTKNEAILDWAFAIAGLLTLAFATIFLGPTA